MEDAGLTNESPDAKPATGAQQAQFDMLLGRCRQVMGEAAQEWLDTLKADPVAGAVTLGTQTLRSMVQMSEQAGQPVDPAVLLNVGIQLCKDIAAVVNEAGLVDDAGLGQYLKDVVSQSMMQYLDDDAKDGLLSPQDKERAAGMMGGAPQGEPVGMLAKMQQGGQP